MATSIYVPTRGIYLIKAGSEQEFIDGLEPDAKNTLVHMNAMGIAVLEIMKNLEPLIVPPPDYLADSTRKALENGILMAGGDVKDAVQKARESVSKMDLARQLQLGASLIQS